MSKRHTRAFWERAAAQVAEGRPSAAVARQLGVHPATLAWWCWKLKQDESPKQKPEFLPVVVRAESSRAVCAPMGVELAVEGVVMRVPVGADPAYVAALIGALRDRC